MFAIIAAAQTGTLNLMNKRIFVKVADVASFPCDVLVLKFAQGFYGADEFVATKLSSSPVQDVQPRPGKYVLLPTNGKVAAKSVFFVGVPPLYRFDYSQIREFAADALQILRGQMPNAAHVAMTIHGVGYGLDERESFLAQLAGILDAFWVGSAPSALERITIVEKNRGRASRLRKILEEKLPPKSSSAGSRSTKQIPRVPRISAGRRSKEKPHVFVAMPFGADMEDVYIFGIQGPVNGAGFLCERVDMAAFTAIFLRE